MIKKSSFENVKVNIPVRVSYKLKEKGEEYGREVNGYAIELKVDGLYVYTFDSISPDKYSYKEIVDVKTITELKGYRTGISVVSDKDYNLFLEIHKYIVNITLKTNKMKKFWFIVGIVLATISLIMIINKHTCNNDNVIKTLPIHNVQNVDTIPSTVREKRK